METFEAKTLDGYTIQLRIIDNTISCGSRFDEYGRFCMHGMTERSKAKIIRNAFEWFRNFAPLLDMSEQKAGLVCFRRASKIVSDDVRNAFWRFMDGCRIVRRGKATCEYKKGTGNRP